MPKQLQSKQLGSEKGFIAVYWDPHTLIDYHNKLHEFSFISLLCDWLVM